MDLECTNGELKEEVETLEVIHSCNYYHIQIMVHGHTYVPTILTFSAVLPTWLSHIEGALRSVTNVAI